MGTCTLPVPLRLQYGAPTASCAASFSYSRLLMGRAATITGAEDSPTRLATALKASCVSPQAAHGMQWEGHDSK